MRSGTVKTTVLLLMLAALGAGCASGRAASNKKKGPEPAYTWKRAVYFDFDRSEVREDARSVLDRHGDDVDAARDPAFDEVVLPRRIERCRSVPDQVHAQLACRIGQLLQHRPRFAKAQRRLDGPHRRRGLA